MPKALIVYTSLTGGTEEMAHILEGELKRLGAEVTVRQCTEAYPSEFKDYDLCVVGTYTYGTDGDLPDEIVDFYFDLKKMDLTGKIFGTFGSGDTIYDYYCKSVDDFDKAFEKIGATRAKPPVKVELIADEDDIEHLKQLAQNLIETYNQ